MEPSGCPRQQSPILLTFFGFKYFYRVQFIFKHMYLTHRRDPNRYNPSPDKGEHGNISSEGLLHTPEKWSLTIWYCLQSYSKHPFFWFGGSSLLSAVDTIFTKPSTRARYDTRSIFKRSLTDLNSESSFSSTSCLTKAEEPSLSYYLPIAGGRRIGFIPFPRVLVLCEMLSVSSKIWTRNAVSISDDDNRNTTGASLQWIQSVYFKPHRQDNELG